MAFTVDRHYSFPFTAVTKSADGDLFCEGLATDGSIDHDQQIVDPQWAASAFKQFFDTGPNIRMAHDGTRPVGVGVDWRQEPGGGIWVKSCIVDPLCQKMLRKHVLRAYSVGISHATVIPDSQAPGGRIVKGSLAELSLVDRPANPNAYVTIAKAVGGRAVYVGKAFKVGKSGKLKFKPGGADPEVVKAAVAAATSELAALIAGQQAAFDAKLAEQQKVIDAIEALDAEVGAGLTQMGMNTPAIAKRAREVLAADDVTAAFLGSSSSYLRELVSEALGGRYGREG